MADNSVPSRSGAGPKTRPTEVSVRDFLAGVADEARRGDCLAVAAMMEAATGEAPVMWGGSIVGFGRYRQRYANGRSEEWPVVGFAPRKNDLTLYLTSEFVGREAMLERLGRFKASKACLYLKKLSDVDATVLRELIDASVAAMAADRVIWAGGAA